MTETQSATVSGWVLAIESRRKALPQRVGMGVAATLIFSPLFGWHISFIWVGVYLAIQLLDLWVFKPISTKTPQALGPLRSAVGHVMLFINAASFGSLSVLLWIYGGPMGGISAAIVLSSGAIYAVVNSPQSAKVLAITIAPQFLYMAATPFFMLNAGADQPIVTSVAIATLVFAAYCINTWQRNNRTAEAEASARMDAEQKRCEAEQAMASRTAFLAMIGHDLRTPISAILTGAHELARGASDTAGRNQAALITDAGQMMKAMLDDLLDHSRLDAGRMTIDDDDFNMRGLLAQTFLFWRGAARAKGLTLRVEGAREMPTYLRGDAMRLRQVLNNLLSNAMKFTQDGSITLRVRAWDEEPASHALLIEISDTGPGMTTDQLSRLFTPFDQTADGVSARHGGSGLGLAISRDLTELMGGRLTARSKPGCGASFTIALILKTGTQDAIPITAPIDPSRGTIVRALSAAPVPAPPELAMVAPEPIEVANLEPEVAPSDLEDRPLRVLVVDDHDINRRAVELILTPLGCDLASAADGLAALRLCETDAFDVIFMDVRMPELDGRETTRRLRASGGINATIPVIAVTADTAPEDIAACMAAGMTYFVSKPLTPTTLLGALSHVLAEVEAQRDAA